MIKSIHLFNVGPKQELKLEFANRLNILTGDNGLGKSYLLDIMWWALTRSWPQDINPKLRCGYMARPLDIKEKAIIECQLAGKNKTIKPSRAEYSARDEAWIGRKGRPINPGLVIYTMSDGSFALWDPSRNYWNNDEYGKEKAQVFSQSEIWDGFEKEETSTYFNGLLRDWELWQTGKTKQFEQLKEVLSVLSTEDEPIELGELKPFRLGDSRKYPTLNTTYKKNVLFPHLSSGVKRIITLGYFLVYAWYRHCESAEQLGEEPTTQITFLIDEMEAHLHPKWQRQIVPALLNVMQKLSPYTDIQLITATHSPLIMTSLEPIFDSENDLWMDFDLKDGVIEVREEVFEKLGSVNNWLESEAFNLKNSYSLEYEKLIAEAEQLISSRRKSEPTKDEIESMRKKLSAALSPTDEFLFYWRSICEKKGYLPHVTNNSSS